VTERTVTERTVTERTVTGRTVTGRTVLGWVALGWAALGGAGCSVGQGEGEVHSDKLFVDGCWDGVFNLRPTFFGANPFEDTLTIRVQRGERDILVSDGLTMLVYDIDGIRADRLGQDLPLGLPMGVSPVGFPLPTVPNRPAATFTLYLNNSCRAQNSQLFAVSGTVNFTQLFSGDLNEENSDDRITEGTFDATVVDPRYAMFTEDADGRMTYTYPEDMTSQVDGYFRFVFHRGTPAQPFP
jgi:hypothetical protein